MQAASDITLGWTIGERDRRHFYVRQLRDLKISVTLEEVDERGLENSANPAAGRSGVRTLGRVPCDDRGLHGQQRRVRSSVCRSLLFRDSQCAGRTAPKLPAGN